METRANERPVSRGKFFDGFLISVAGWILTSLASTPIYSFFAFNRNLGWDHFTIVTSMFLPFAIILLVFWLPISIIAGILSLKNKFRSALIMVIICFFVLSALVPFGVGILFALAGAY